MSFNLYHLRRRSSLAGLALLGIGLAVGASGQTLPIAGNPQQAAAQESGSIRGLREQDEAATRISNQLNNSAAQAAAQSGAAGQAQAANSDALLQAGIAIDARNPNRTV